ncbi:MAG: glycosyltransferase family 4 protein [Steroidobacteraceae bacterium]
MDSEDVSDNTIVQLTTVHPRNDTRILYRQTHALARCPQWSVTLLVADGQGSGTKDIAGVAVRIVDVGKPAAGRLGRAVIGSLRALAQTRKLGAALVHFHDPELIPAGMILKLLGCKVIYDVHEDYPLQILHKYWLPPILRRPTAWSMKAVEWLAARLFDAVVCANPKAAERFPRGRTVIVQNFPIAAELVVPEREPYGQRPHSFVYVGGIASIRGARKMVEAIDILDVAGAARLDFAGSYSPASLEAELSALPGWSRVRYHGWATRPEVAKLLSEARAGLVVLQPTQNYPDAYPVKMFEYMAAGVPVIASDFPLWRSIVDGARCGLLVDPTDSTAIAAAMHWILEHPSEAEAMGRRGRSAVEQTYNWTRESEKLLRLYSKLMPAS